LTARPVRRGLLAAARGGLGQRSTSHGPPKCNNQR
jgi:hypothetical protein